MLLLISISGSSSRLSPVSFLCYSYPSQDAQVVYLQSPFFVTPHNHFGILKSSISSRLSLLLLISISGSLSRLSPVSYLCYSTYPSHDPQVVYLQSPFFVTPHIHLMIHKSSISSLLSLLLLISISGSSCRLSPVSFLCYSSYPSHDPQVVYLQSPFFVTPHIHLRILKSSLSSLLSLLLLISISGSSSRLSPVSFLCYPTYPSQDPQVVYLQSPFFVTPHIHLGILKSSISSLLSLLLHISISGSSSRLSPVFFLCYSTYPYQDPQVVYLQSPFFVTPHIQLMILKSSISSLLSLLLLSPHIHLRIIKSSISSLLSLLLHISISGSSSHLSPVSFLCYSSYPSQDPQVVYLQSPFFVTPHIHLRMLKSSISSLLSLLLLSSYPSQDHQVVYLQSPFFVTPHIHLRIIKSSISSLLSLLLLISISGSSSRLSPVSFLCYSSYPTHDPQVVYLQSPFFVTPQSSYPSQDHQVVYLQSPFFVTPHIHLRILKSSISSLLSLLLLSPHIHLRIIKSSISSLLSLLLHISISGSSSRLSPVSFLCYSSYPSQDPQVVYLQSPFFVTPHIHLMILKSSISSLLSLLLLISISGSSSRLSPVSFLCYSSYPSRDPQVVYLQSPFFVTPQSSYPSRDHQVVYLQSPFFVTPHIHLRILKSSISSLLSLLLLISISGSSSRLSPVSFLCYSTYPSHDPQVVYLQSPFFVTPHIHLGILKSSISSLLSLLLLISISGSSSRLSPVSFLCYSSYPTHDPQVVYLQSPFFVTPQSSYPSQDHQVVYLQSPFFVTPHIHLRILKSSISSLLSLLLLSPHIHLRIIKSSISSLLSLLLHISISGSSSRLSPVSFLCYSSYPSQDPQVVYLQSPFFVTPHIHLMILKSSISSLLSLLLLISISGSSSRLSPVSFLCYSYPSQDAQVVYLQSPFFVTPHNHFGILKSSISSRLSLLLLISISGSLSRLSPVSYLCYSTYPYHDPQVVYLQSPFFVTPHIHLMILKSSISSLLSLLLLISISGSSSRLSPVSFLCYSSYPSHDPQVIYLQSPFFVTPHIHLRILKSVSLQSPFFVTPHIHLRILKSSISSLLSLLPHISISGSSSRLSPVSFLCYSTYPSQDPQVVYLQSPFFVTPHIHLRILKSSISTSLLSLLLHISSRLSPVSFLCYSSYPSRDPQVVYLQSPFFVTPHIHLRILRSSISSLLSLLPLISISGSSSRLSPVSFLCYPSYPYQDPQVVYLQSPFFVTPHIHLRILKSSISSLLSLLPLISISGSSSRLSPASFLCCCPCLNTVLYQLSSHPGPASQA